jgi:hypothetical protein
MEPILSVFIAAAAFAAPGTVSNKYPQASE